MKKEYIRAQIFMSAVRDVITVSDISDKDIEYKEDGTSGGCVSWGDIVG